MNRLTKWIFLILVILTAFFMTANMLASQVKLYETNMATRIGMSNLYTLELMDKSPGSDVRVSAFLSLGYDVKGWVIPFQGPGNKVRCNLVRDPLFYLTAQAVRGNTTSRARNWHILALLTPRNPQYQWMELILPNDRRLIGIRFYGQAVAYNPYVQSGPTLYDREPLFTGPGKRFTITR
jgi:hypothetical protein